jgi:hypothetical protein
MDFVAMSADIVRPPAFDAVYDHMPFDDPLRGLLVVSPHWLFLVLNGGADGENSLPAVLGVVVTTPLDRLGGEMRSRTPCARTAALAHQAG